MYYRPIYGLRTTFKRRRLSSNSNYTIPSIGTSVGLNNTMSYTTTGSSRRSSPSGQGVTSQYDKKTIYYRKSMPRYKRRRWVKFIKKVGAVEMKGLGTKTVLKNTQITLGIANDGQMVLSSSIYGKNGNADTSAYAGNRDLKVIFDNDPDLNTPTSKALFGSAVMDLTFTNMTTKLDDSFQNTNIEVDVYEWTTTKKGVYPSLVGVGSLVSAAESATGNISGGGPSIGILDRGCTPFDLPDLAARGLKIWKKTKFLLSVGESATYQMRDARNRVFRNDNIDDGANSFIYPNITRGVLFIVKGVPTIDATKVFKNIQIGATRKYMYKVIKNNISQDQNLS